MPIGLARRARHIDLPPKRQRLLPQLLLLGAELPLGRLFVVAGLGLPCGHWCSHGRGRSGLRRRRRCHALDREARVGAVCRSAATSWRHRGGRLAAASRGQSTACCRRRRWRRWITHRVHYPRCSCAMPRSTTRGSLVQTHQAPWSRCTTPGAWLHAVRLRLGFLGRQMDWSIPFKK